MASFAELTTEVTTFLTATWRAFRVFLAVLRAGSGVATQPAAAPGDLGLPDSYGRTRLVALPVDPFALHAYWEVTSATLSEAAARMRMPPREAQAALRFHDADGVQAAFDVDVDLKAHNWFVSLWRPGASYELELGLRTSAGRFVSLARSSRVQMPRAWPVEEVREHFMRVSGEQREAEIILPPQFRKPALLGPQLAVSALTGVPLHAPAAAAHKAPFRRRGGATGWEGGSEADLAGVVEHVFIPGISSMPPSSSSG